MLLALSEQLTHLSGYIQRHQSRFQSGWWILPAVPAGIYLWVEIIRTIVGWLQ